MPVETSRVDGIRRFSTAQFLGPGSGVQRPSQAELVLPESVS
jgi:hypothetical protein